VKQKDQIDLVQDYMNFLGKIYIILLSSLDDFSDASLSTNEKVVLQILDKEAISMKDISQRTGLALSTLTNVIDKMEEKKLVRRRHSRQDRRMVKIELAATGRRIQTRFNKLIKVISSTLLDILSKEDRHNFVTALQRISQVTFAEPASVRGNIVDMLEPIRMTMVSQVKKK